ncbi:MAG: arginase family protein, partial [Pseudomonadota bacterium]
KISPRAANKAAKDGLKDLLLPTEETLPVLLGGDQSIARHIPDFLSPPFTVLHFSSSPDLLKEGAVRSLLDRDLAVVSVGVRELTAIEAQFIKKSPLGYDCFLAKENRQSWPTEVPQAIQTDAVVLVFDANVFDISVMPAVETPSPGGLSWVEVTSLLKAVSSQKRVSAVLMTGLKPHPFLHAADFLMAKLLYKILGYCFVPR